MPKRTPPAEFVGLSSTRSGGSGTGDYSLTEAFSDRALPIGAGHRRNGTERANAGSDYRTGAKAIAHRLPPGARDGAACWPFSRVAQGGAGASARRPERAPPRAAAAVPGAPGGKNQGGGASTACVASLWCPTPCATARRSDVHHRR
jgi:hypothetical protein